MAELMAFIENLLHGGIDLLVSIVYFFFFVFEILKGLLTPINYALHFVEILISGLFKSVSNVEPINFNAEIMSLFSSIPLFDILVPVAVGTVCLVMVLGILKEYSR